jgi:hypothetical protein
MMDATFTDSKNRVACPASLQFGDLINSGQVHYASRKQIEKHGLCRKCRKRMKEHGKAILAGKLETPVDLNEQHHAPTVEQDHVAFADGELTQSTDFDYAEVDRALGLVEAAPPDARQQAGELVRQIFTYCFQSKRKLNLRTAAAKLAVIGAGLRPDALADESQTELAASLGLTKAALSKASVKFQDAFGVKFQRSRSSAARAHMAAARLAQDGVSRHKRKDTSTSNQTVTTGQAEPGGMATTPAVRNPLILIEDKP